MVLFSQRTVQLPSVELSQKHELLVWTPAPFFCTTTHVTRKQMEIFMVRLWYYYIYHSNQMSFLFNLKIWYKCAEKILFHCRMDRLWNLTINFTMQKITWFNHISLIYHQYVLSVNLLDTINIMHFYIAKNLPMYLKGFCNLTKDCKQQSIIEDDHWLTLLCKYVFPPMTDSMASLIAALWKNILFLTMC
jgi:hypothetical protein